MKIKYNAKEETINKVFLNGILTKEGGDYRLEGNYIVFNGGDTRQIVIDKTQIIKF